MGKSHLYKLKRIDFKKLKLNIIFVKLKLNISFIYTFDLINSLVLKK